MPLILLLHGSGERGTDNVVQLGNGVAELLGSLTSPRPPCFSLVPQCPADRRWVEMDWTDDPARIYLIGLLMGGFGVWDLLSRLPERFAAAVPICGGADERAVAAARSVPIWSFHGALDPVVPVERSRRAIGALRAAGGTPRYTEYPEAGHDSWTFAFGEPDLFPGCSPSGGQRPELEGAGSVPEMARYRR